MIKITNQNNALEYMRTCILLENHMDATLQKWHLNTDVSEVLENYPWLDETSARFTYLEDNLKEVFLTAEEFLNLQSQYIDEGTASAKVQVELYFKSMAIKTMKQTMEAEIGVNDNEFMAWRGRFERAFTALRHYIYNAFGAEEYLTNPIKNILFTSYEAHYGNLKEYFEMLRDYCNENPLFITHFSADDASILQSFLNDSMQVSQEEFSDYSEAVMPWDITAMKRGELKIDSNYMARLKRRVEDDTSIYNNMHTIYSILDKLPDERCKDLYDYEFMITLSDVEYIKEGSKTFAQVLDNCKALANTSFF